MSCSKSKGGLGFRDLHGFNVALLGKHVWNFTHNPNSLVSRVFKERYFPDSNVLMAKRGQGSSFLWSGIWSAREELAKGFRWVLGNGNDIVATRDPWLRSKNNFLMEQDQRYEQRNEVVSSLFIQNERKWNVALVRDQFLHIDAEAILKTYIPQREVPDRVVWVNSSNGIYNAKSAYQYWYNVHVGHNIVPQSTG